MNEIGTQTGRISTAKDAKDAKENSKGQKMTTRERICVALDQMTAHQHDLVLPILEALAHQATIDRVNAAIDEASRGRAAPASDREVEEIERRMDRNFDVGFDNLPGANDSTPGEFDGFDNLHSEASAQRRDSHD